MNVKSPAVLGVFLGAMMAVSSIATQMIRPDPEAVRVFPNLLPLFFPFVLVFRTVTDRWRDDELSPPEFPRVGLRIGLVSGTVFATAMLVFSVLRLGGSFPTVVALVTATAFGVTVAVSGVAALVATWRAQRVPKHERPLSLR